jgi:hypothetical protein
MQCPCVVLPTGLPGSAVNFTLSQKSMIVKKIIEHKICVLNFSTTFILNVTHSKKNLARYDQKDVGFHVKYPLFLSDVQWTWIFSAHFEKYQYIKFLESLSIGSRVVPCERRDRHDEANCRFSKFCESA